MVTDTVTVDRVFMSHTVAQGRFSYNLPDEVLAACDDIALRASGQIQIIEEAITSSQLEGPSATRRDAKEMIRVGSWLAEHLSISRLLLKAPAKYARSLLMTEQDWGDLTHFFIFRLGMIQRAIGDLHGYLREKALESGELQARIHALPAELNHRQRAALDHASKNPTAIYTVRSHGSSHRVTIETARHDLATLL